MNKKHKFLFIASTDHYANGIRLLASILRKNGHDTEILFFRRFCNELKNKLPPTEYDWELLERTVQNFHADWIGVSLTSLKVIDEEKLIHTIKSASPDSILMAGGFGPTFECKRYLNYGVDYVCRGEGEYAISEVARIIDNSENHQDCHEELRKIPNLAWYENGELHANHLHPLISLKGLPIALYGNDYITLIEDGCVKKHDPMLEAGQSYGLLSSRGCVGRCTYCCGSSWQNIYRDEHLPVKKYRIRPTEEVITECENAKELGAKQIWFWDEFFVRSESEYFKFFNEYKNKIGLPFNMNANIEFMMKDEARFKSIFEAGLNRVAVGIQSASPFIIKEVFQRPFDASIKLQAINQFHNHWIETCVHFITGHSMESEADFEYSLDFIRELPFSIDWPMRTHLLTFPLGLYPGAAIGDMFPIIKENPMTKSEKEFRMRIMVLRHILKNDDAFDEIYRNRAFRDNPYLLNIIIKDTFNELTNKFWEQTVEKLKNKDVIFWGCGETYQLYKLRFKYSKPKAIVVDNYAGKQKIDGIKIVPPEEIINTNKTPIIIFTPKIREIATRILRISPEQNDIVACYNAQYPFVNFK